MKGDNLMLPIIDTHQHLWDLTQFDIPWLKGGGPLSRNHVLSDYEREAQGLNIVQTVYMEVDVAPADRIREAETVLALCHQPHTPLAGAVIGGNPLDKDFKAYVERFVHDKHFKGVRQVLHGGQERGTCLLPPFVSSMDLLGEHNLIYDLCMRPDEIADGAKLARQCPHTRFVLDHCGNPDIYAASDSPERLQWQRDMAELAQCPNVVCKISGIVAQVRQGVKPAEDLAPLVNHCVQVFGHDRVMFASDWPVCTLGASLADWVHALQTITQAWSDTDRRNLFHDNAERFYALV
jgi:L-fuconolactonase